MVLLNMLFGGTSVTILFSIFRVAFVQNYRLHIIMAKYVYVQTSLLFSFSVRSLGYQNDAEKKPSQLELVTVQATAGTLAGACSSIITTPIDTVKTRLQVYLVLSCSNTH